jgi:hypothetical protein
VILFQGVISQIIRIERRIIEKPHPFFCGAFLIFNF